MNNKYKSAEEYIKVPLQSKGYNGRRVYAYLRRSTAKEGQIDSLNQQKDGITMLAKLLGIPEENIVFFEETRSGFENRTRKEWARMLANIDSDKTPVIILCRDTSRLSRNPTDNLEITNRMFGDNKHKKIIEKIYFLDENCNLQEWNNTSGDKIEITNTLHKNYIESLETKKKTKQGVNLKLDAGEYPFSHPPYGLVRSNIYGTDKPRRGETSVLKQTEIMPYIQKAFEMKAQKKTAKEICKYLRKASLGKININSKHLSEKIFAKEVYKGTYTDTISKKEYTLKFFEGHPPIKPELWNLVNNNKRKRGSGFGLIAQEHLAPGKIISADTGRVFSLYKQKGYNQYQTEIKKEDGTRSVISISEKKIIEKISKELYERINNLYNILGRYSPSFVEREDLETLNDKELQKFFNSVNANNAKHGNHFPVVNSIDEYLAVYKHGNLLERNIDYHKEKIQIDDQGIDDYIEEMYQKHLGMSRDEVKKLPPEKGLKLSLKIQEELDKEADARMEKIMENISQKITTGTIDDIRETGNIMSTLNSANIIMEDNMAKHEMTNMISGLPFGKNILENKHIRDIKREEIQKEIKTKEHRLESVDLEVFEKGFDAKVANKMKEKIYTEIEILKNQLEDLENSMDLSDYIGRLPEIIKNIHELASNMHNNAEIEDFREDLKLLIEMVIHELEINKQKELKIKLFKGLEILENLNFRNGAQSGTGTHTPHGIGF